MLNRKYLKSKNMVIISKLFSAGTHATTKELGKDAAIELEN
jgi:hypothetical protein